jgi:hypothetical protein
MGLVGQSMVRGGSKSRAAGNRREMAIKEWKGGRGRTNPRSAVYHADSPPSLLSNKLGATMQVGEDRSDEGILDR